MWVTKERGGNLGQIKRSKKKKEEGKREKEGGLKGLRL